MCGIAGFLDVRSPDEDESIERVRCMCNAVAHRGPDDSGVWVDAAAGIALGHRRLSIIELSPLGHQPMASGDGRYVMSFNGEVYNFLELRAELEALGHRFHGGSDTEVMLAAFVGWGLLRAVAKFVGMFAFAVWDRQNRTLYLVRDRVGVKPLYWSLKDGVLLFGSELKALMMHPAWRGEIDRDAAAALIRYSYIPAPGTIFLGVQKLEPGTMLMMQAGSDPRVEAFWRLRDVAARGVQSQINDESEGADGLDAVLRHAVRDRLMADVPLGAFLSGGIDSSTVVALMQAQSNSRIRTFSIGFHEKIYDEAQYAKAVAAHLGTDHTEMYVSARDALDVIPRLPCWFDEPFADPSQIPTYLVSAMTRKHVTVALSGDGGDELFGGYPRYGIVEKVWRKIAFAPMLLRRNLGILLQRVPESVLDRLFSRAPGSMRMINGGRRLRRLGELLMLPTSDALYVELLAVCAHERRLMVSPGGVRRLVTEPDLSRVIPDLVARMQYIDTLNYLPDDILVKVDRCSMAVALEARQPFLDHRLIEFVWRLPQAFKIENGQAKRLLRSVLYRYVPPNLVDRPKMGFSIPLAEWLRGPLRDWAEGLLASRRVAAEGIFKADEVRRLWSEHQSHRADREVVLWNLLMFQAWKEHYRVA